MRQVIDSARPTGILRRLLSSPLARWQSGYAAACKAVDAGSIPTLASNSPVAGILRMPGAVLLLLLLIAVAPRAVFAAESDLEQRVDAYLQPYLEIGHLSGTILIAQGDDIVYEKSFGLADREFEVANTPDTLFGIGSVNKPMTIVILARLIEDGEIALSDTLATYAPDFPRSDEITVEDLLNHSAGIAHRVTRELDETRPQTAASASMLAAKTELVFEPGSDSVYSSAGFSVLARVMEIASGK